MLGLPYITNLGNILNKIFNRRKGDLSKMNKKLGIFIGLSISLLLTACAQSEEDSSGVGESVDSFMHVHGLSYDPEEPHDLYLSTHHGLIQIDSEEQWSWTSAPEHRHDLMSFTFQDENTMISSGHPAENSNLENPIGVVISEDQGEIWEPIALHGEVDFHVMEVNASDPETLYGIDAAGTGFYRSVDGGFNWEIIEANGLPEDYSSVYSLVSDPGNSESILAGTQQGIFESHDGAENWEFKSNEQTMIIGEGVYQKSETIVAYLLGQPSGLMISEDFGESWRSLNMVLEDDDAVVHIAIHPSEEGVYAVGTSREDLIHTTNGGEDWTQLAESGEPLE